MTGRRSGERLGRYWGWVAMGEGAGFGPAAWVRAAAVVGRLAEQRAGLNLGRLNEQEVRRKAARQLGHPVVGDDPGLRVLLADLAQAPLTPLGRLWLRSELIRREVTEARLRDEFRRQPGLLDSPLWRPLVVVGLPRTGTTLLHTLLGCDPEALVVPFWRLRRPYPIPRAKPGPGDPDHAGSGHGETGPVDGATAAGHPSGHSPRPGGRCLHVPRHRHARRAVAAPGYLGWLQATDPAPAYRTCRRHLQALLADRPGRRPVLKSPSI